MLDIIAAELVEFGKQNNVNLCFYHSKWLRFNDATIISLYGQWYCFYDSETKGFSVGDVVYFSFSDPTCVQRLKECILSYRNANTT